MKKREIDKNPIAGSREVAAMAGISPELVRKLARQGTISKIGRDRYELRKTLPSLYRHLWRSRLRDQVFGKGVDWPFGL